MSDRIEKGGGEGGYIFYRITKSIVIEVGQSSTTKKMLIIR